MTFSNNFFRFCLLLALIKLFRFSFFLFFFTICSLLLAPLTIHRIILNPAKSTIQTKVAVTEIILALETKHEDQIERDQIELPGPSRLEPSEMIWESS